MLSPNALPSLGAPPRALVETELARINASAVFRRSPRHRTLLRYLVTKALAGEHAGLKEAVLAADVFGRDPTRFDPQRDTIVRVEARRLRQKLVRYYEEDGANSAIVVRLEAGRYAPIVELRPESGGEDPLPSVAVLPFVNLSGCPEHESFCDALTEELIDALVQIPGLKVVARTSVFRFKGRNDDVRATARTLGVRTVVEGSVQRHGGEWRVVAQLINADDGIHLWSHAFDALAERASGIVPRLARAVIRGLKLHDGATTRLRRVALRASANAEAQDCFERGKYLLGRQSRDAYRNAIELFVRATAADPQFALAWAALAQARIGLFALTAVPESGAIDAIRLAVARALELDPELGEAHAAASFVAFACDRDFARAERASLEAIRYAPSRAYVHHHHAWMLMFAGRFDEADQTFAIARELDPVSLLPRIHQALVALYRRDYARAADGFVRVLEVEPANLLARVLLATTWLCDARVDDALAAFARIEQEVPGDSIGPLGIVQSHARAGREREARAALASMIERFGEDRIGPYRMAIAHARLGDGNATFAWLDRAAEALDMNLVCLAVDPSFDRVRDDARFARALARYGLPVIDARASSAS
jgi:TolB-like protein/Tfp pilus assembly protein PilF